MSPKRARKHHILPKKYLSRFSKNEQIYVHDFDIKRSIVLNIQEAAIIKDFYTVKTEDSQEDDLIEQNFLAQIEGQCDPAIDEIINKHSFSGKDVWSKLVNYVALMYVRTPLFRQIFLETYEQYSNQMADDLVENEDFYYQTMNAVQKHHPEFEILPFKEAKKARYQCDVTVDIPRTYYIKQMMLLANKVVPIIARMTPNVFLAPKFLDAKFITGDVPIIPISRKPCDSSIWIGNPETDLYFPLSSYCCLVLNYDTLPKVSNISQARIAHINHLIACNCTRIILSEEQSFYWMNEKRTISKDIDDLLNSWGDEKKTRFRGTRINKNRPTVCRNDWGHLTSKDPSS